jgi:hypothetical protein
VSVSKDHLRWSLVERKPGKINSSVCLFLDDLHWADRAPLNLLHYLIRHLPDAPIWFVGTYRPEEVALSHPLTRLRQGLGRDRRAERLALEPLPDGSVRALAHALVGERDSAALGGLPLSESEGESVHPGGDGHRSGRTWRVVDEQRGPPGRIGRRPGPAGGAE